MNITQQDVFNALSDSWSMAHKGESKWTYIIAQIGFISTLLGVADQLVTDADDLGSDLLILVDIAAYHHLKKANR